MLGRENGDTQVRDPVSNSFYVSSCEHENIVNYFGNITTLRFLVVRASLEVTGNDLTPKHKVLYLWLLSKRSYR